MTAPLREQFANTAQDTLNGSITNSVTSVVLNDASEFPSAGNFRIKVEDEIMLATARSTNTLTVVRGQEGTTAASHGSGVTCAQILTNDSIDRWGKDNRPLWGYSSVPPLNKLVAADGSTLLTTSDFTWTNQSTATASDQGGTILMRASATSGTNFRILRRVAPTAPWTLITAVRPHVQGINSSSINCQIGLLARQSTSGKFITLAVNRQSTQPMRFGIDHWTNETTYAGSTPFTGANQILASDSIWMRIIDDNTNLKFSISDDGVEWIQILSQSRSALMTLNGGVTGPDQIGFTINNGGDSSAPDALLRLTHWHVE